MKLIKPVSASIMIILSFSVLIIAGCGAKQTFSGSKTSNDNQFIVDFEVLNSTVRSTMELSKGETIETTIKIKKGDVDIVVENENGTLAYQENDVESGNFIIKIKEAGI